MSTEENQQQTEQHQRKFTIHVNSRERKVDTDELTYDQVVALAFNPVPTGPDVYFAVTYRDAAGDKSGTLDEGQSVKIKDGTVFDVVRANRS
jgi:Multiubiquitin